MFYSAALHHDSSSSNKKIYLERASWRFILTARSIYSGQHLGLLEAFKDGIVAL